MISQEIKGQWCLYTAGEEVQHSMSFQDSIKINLLLLRDGFETTAFMDPDAMVRHKELYFSNFDPFIISFYFDISDE